MATKVSALSKTNTLDNDDLIYIAKEDSFAITKADFENTLSLNTNTNSRIVSGAVVWVSGLTYETVDLIYEINGVQFNITNGTQVTLSAADPTNPRIDVIYGDDSGDILVEEGTPAATPVKPTIQEGFQIELTFATISATATEPDGVGIDTLYLEDVGQPTEWDATDNTGGLRIDVADTSAPITGAVSIKSIDTIVTGDSFTLTNATPVNTAELSYLRLSIKLLSTWGAKDMFVIILKSGSTQISTFNLDRNVLDGTDTTSVQTITIFNASFSSFAGTSFDNIEFYNRNKGGLSYIVDDISILTSDVITNPTNVTGADVSLDTTNFDKNLNNTITDVQKFADAFDEYVAAGGGDVNGPVSSVDENIVVFDGVGGKTIKDSGINQSAVTANTAKVTNATHTGDVTGATALTIADEAVTNAKLAHIATSTIKGRKTAATGDVEDLTVTQTKQVLEDRILVDATVITTQDLDYSLYEQFDFIVTGAVTFTESNLPTTGTNGKVIILTVTGDFAITYPAGWSTNITGTYDGTVQNTIVVWYFKTSGYKVQITQPD